MLMRIVVQKVDVDRVQAVAARYSVRAMPTFIVLKGGNKVGEVSEAKDVLPRNLAMLNMYPYLEQMMGANPAGLANLIKTHAGSPPPAGSTQASGSGSGSSSTPAEPGVVSREYRSYLQNSIPNIA
jgi:hypothetical protein